MAVESDFQREYGIDLSEANMSYRRFSVLFSGLSANSLCIRIAQNKKQNKKLPKISTPEGAKKLWKGLFG